MRNTEKPMRAVLQTLKDPQLDRSALRALLETDERLTDPARLIGASGMILICGVADDCYDGFVEAIAAVTARRIQVASLSDPAERMLAEAGELVARWFASLDDAAIPELVERVVEALSTSAIDVNLRAAAAVAVLSYEHAKLDREKIWWVDLAMRAVVADPRLAPHLESECHNQLVISYFAINELARGVALCRKREASGDAVSALKLLLLDARIAIGERRTEDGRVALQRCERLLDSRLLVQAGMWHFLSSRLCMLENRLSDALAHARLALRMLTEAHYPEPWMGTTIMQEGQVLLARGDSLEAESSRATNVGASYSMKRESAFRPSRPSCRTLCLTAVA